MAFKDRWAGASAIAGVIGQRVFTDLENGRRTNRINLGCTLGINVTVAGAGVRNNGSLLGAWDEVGMVEGGKEVVVLDARAAHHLGLFFAGSNVRSTRLAGAGVQNITARENIVLHLAHPTAAKQEESVFTERNVNNKLQVFAKYNGLAANIVSGGTVALTAPQITVTQDLDEMRGTPPAVNIHIRQLNEEITAANPQKKIDLTGERFLAGILVQQDAGTVGEVSDIINSLVFRGDGNDIIGPGKVSWADLTDFMSDQSGGAGHDLTWGRSWWAYNFVNHGRMSAMLNPDELKNLRLEVDCQPTAAAGATSSNIRVIIVEYERRQGITAAEMGFSV